MSQHYSDPSRETEPTALPDIEVWSDKITVINSDCGTFEVGSESENARGFCPSCNRATCVHALIFGDDSGVVQTDRVGWFWWTCFPGCLPDSEPNGPFDTEAEALADAREGMEE